MYLRLCLRWLVLFLLLTSLDLAALEMAKITVYISTVSSNMEIKKKQQKINMILSSKKVDYEEVDISASEDAKAKMREIAGDPKALPPQICNGDTYCGDYAAFENAVEDEKIEEFLKLK